MLLKDIRTLTINQIKFSRTSNANAIFKIDQAGGRYVPGSNVAGGVGISGKKAMLFSVNPYIDTDGTKWYAVYTHDNYGPIRWVPEEDIDHIELTGGVIKSLYSTIHKAFHRFNRKAVVTC